MTINNNNTKYTIQGDLYPAKFGNGDLVAACGRGDVQCVRRILESGLDPNFQVPKNPLRLASRDGHIGVVRELLAHKADVDMPDEDGWTALILASGYGHTDVVQELLANGADVDMRDKDERTALMLAIRHGYPETAKALVAKEASVDMRDKDGRTVLMMAAIRGYTDIAKALVAKGASVDMQDTKGWTALMMASYYSGGTEIVEALLAKGANVDVRDEDGRTALMMATYSGTTGVVKALLANACGKGDVEYVRRILESGVDPNFRTTEGMTPLILASRDGHLGVVGELLAHKADVDMQDKDGVTALMLAALNGHTEIVKALLARGASVDMRDTYGQTALMAAVARGHSEVMKELLECGANICIVECHGINTLRMLREKFFPGYMQIKTDLALLSPESKEYNDFYRIVKNVCHVYDIEGMSHFRAARGDIVFDRLGVLDGTYYSSIFAKNVSSFSAKITASGAVQESLSNICRMLEEYAVSTHDSTDELAKRYAQGTPILVSGGFEEHAVVYCFWNTHCILVNRGGGSRKPIEIFPIEEKTFKDPALFKRLLSEIQRIKSGTEAEFKKFVNDEFQKPQYLPQTALESILEKVLALPEQTVGNCGFASTEGAVFALFALEALHAKGLLNQGECDGARQGEIREVVERQREIFDEFSAFLKARYRDKYLTEVPLEHQEPDILQRLSPQRLF